MNESLFFMNLFILLSSSFVKKTNFNSTTISGEHREHNLGEVRPKKIERTQNFIKNNLTGRVDIHWPILEKIAKKSGKN